jgi:hypothetical protein
MIQQNDKNIATFAKVCDNLIRSFKLKIMIHRRRENLLSSTNHNFELIDDDFLRKLTILLQKERKIIHLIKGDEDNLDTAIEKTLKMLVRFNKDTKFPALKKGFYIVPDEAKALLQQIHLFIKRIQKDLTRIEHRILIESKFVQSKDKKSFKEYLSVWEKEHKEHQIMKKHFSDLIEKTQPYVNTISSAGFNVSFASIITMWYSQYKISTMYGNMEFDNVYIMSVLLSIAIGLCMMFKSISKEEIIEENIDDKLIKEFKPALS